MQKFIRNIIFVVILILSFSVKFISAQTYEDFRKIPSLKWQFSISSPFYSSPLVNNNMVYIGGLDSALHIIDVKNGNEFSRINTGGEIRSNVCFDDNSFYLNGGDGCLYSFDIISKKLNWKFLTNGEKKYDFADYFHSTPVLYNGIIYCGFGDGKMYAVNSCDGKLIWSFKAEDIIHNTPAISNDKIFFGSFDGYIYALKIKTGELLWRYKTKGHEYFPKGEVQGSPAVYRNTVIVGARDYIVYALNQESGNLIWEKSFSKGWGLCNNVYNSRLYIGCADERKLISANPESGKEFWSLPMEFLIFGNNAYSETMLYVGTTIGKLHAISQTSGSKLWSYETESYQSSRSKYFKDDDSYRDDIYSIIKSNEHFLEVEQELGGIFSTPYIFHNSIIFSSTNGKIYCLSK